MKTVALEFVPPSAEAGLPRLLEEAEHVATLLRRTGIDRRVNALLVPGMIAEDSDRPVPLEEKMDPLEVCRAVRSVLPLEPIVTQVTAFSSFEALGERLRSLRQHGVSRVVFVGVPRTLADGQGPGLAPTDAIESFQDVVPHRGVILIPTRHDEKLRFEAKLRAGANFALSQLLCSDAITRLLPAIELSGPRPEILLSFGYVPRVEERVGLIQWLIRDHTPAAQAEMEWVARVAPLSFAEKKRALVDVYERVIEGVQEGGFPIRLHFECPYGFNEYAFETFQTMLDVWSP